jgi:hypothetical protein
VGSSLWVPFIFGRRINAEKYRARPKLNSRNSCPVFLAPFFQRKLRFLKKLQGWGPILCT